MDTKGRESSREDAKMKKITRDEIELEVLRYFSQQRVDVFNKAALGLDKKNFKLMVFPELEDYDTMGIRHIFRLVGTDKLLQTYPSDWWQALKERWMPKRMQRISPVKYTEVIARHIFPFLKEELGDEVVRIFIKIKEVTK